MGQDMHFSVRQLAHGDMEAAARVHRASFDERLPWLAGLHTPEEDRWFFGEVVFAACEAWGAFEAGMLTGFIAFRPGWVEQLYVIPAAQGRGAGGALLAIAQDRHGELNLWTFQRNVAARRFYEKRGFVAVELTDGSRNEEKEPDVRYLWRIDRATVG